MADPLMEISLPCENICKIVKLKVKPKASVAKGTIIATYSLHGIGQADSHKDEILKFKSDNFGTVEELMVSEGDVVQPGTTIIKLASCTHPTVMKDMCAECGADLREAQGLPGQRRQTSTASVAMVHSIPELQVSKEVAYQLAKLDEGRLLKSRKLVLVVDLDQTIIHTTMDNIAPDLPGVCHFQLWGSGARHPWYHTKMRPGYKAFLQKASSLYELHIFTMGARLYAHTIAAYLDPEKKYFSHRILSRDECFDPNSKTANLRSIFPCGDNMVVIIDDREDVWNYAPNLIMVPPYKYFEGTGDINAPPGLADSKGVLGKEDPPSEKEIEDSAKESEVEEGTDCTQTKEASDVEMDVTVSDKELKSSEDKDNPLEKETNVKDGDAGSKTTSEDKTKENGNQNSQVKKVVPEEESGDSDDYFLYLADILKQIHKEFYDAYDHLQEQPDLKIILPSLRQKILTGVNLVFSGVFPTNINPEQSKAWKVASLLGAHISPNIIYKAKGSTSPSNATTHVIAAKAGTSKVHAAQRAKNIHIVTPEWLWCCWERWQRVDERLFKLFSGHARPDSASLSSSRASTPCTSDSEAIRKLAQDKFLKKHKSKQAGKARAISDGEEYAKRRKLSPDSKTDTIQSSKSRTSGKQRQVSLSSEYNPVFSFSSEELESMDKEVEGIFEESSSSSSSDSDSGNLSKQESLGSITQAISSSSDESLTAENPLGWTKKQLNQENESDHESGSEDSSSSAGLSDSDPSSSDEDRMAAEIDDLLTYSKS
ncbi:RNA polymerase II subunit A C-terminal domain phosphatase-like [Asterias rubens]|uniref:RNA polymerase II subunit A C-terminal domain phosphatase-like n=1 Tax=Asterias rubens TaxID=7604 RepID=UPI0014550220|nr:RNA polymerase II subunit A C-terminal domain phosphatase-like [Asterias rubens]